MQMQQFNKYISMLEIQRLIVSINVKAKASGASHQGSFHLDLRWEGKGKRKKQRQLPTVQKPVLPLTYFIVIELLLVTDHKL